MNDKPYDWADEENDWPELSTTPEPRHWVNPLRHLASLWRPLRRRR